MSNLQQMSVLSSFPTVIDEWLCYVFIMSKMMSPLLLLALYLIPLHKRIDLEWYKHFLMVTHIDFKPLLYLWLSLLLYRREACPFMKANTRRTHSKFSMSPLCIRPIKYLFELSYKELCFHRLSYRVSFYYCSFLSMPILHYASFLHKCLLHLTWISTSFKIG